MSNPYIIPNVMGPPKKKTQWVGNIRLADPDPIAIAKRLRGEDTFLPSEELEPMRDGPAADPPRATEGGLSDFLLTPTGQALIASLIFLCYALSAALIMWTTNNFMIIMGRFALAAAAQPLQST
jgi:hypothetical protein